MQSFQAIALLYLVSSSVEACSGIRPRQSTSDNQTDPSLITRIKPPAPTDKVALTNVRVFDGFKVNDASTVWIDGTVISEELDSVDYVLDGNNGILMPGFIDGHNHANSIEDLQELSAYGVTTSFVMNCYNYTVCSSLKDQTGLTSVFVAGYSAKGPNSSHAINGDAQPNELIYGPYQAPEYVRQVFANGSDYLKIVSEANGPSQETQNALVLQAHNYGKKVMTHATDLEHYAQAVYSNTDGPQHTPLDGYLNDTVLQQMYLNKQFATPTMAVYYYELHIPGAAAMLGIANGNFDTMWPVIQTNVMAMKKAGIPIITGTDASPPYAGQSIPFGSTVHDEMWYFVQAGFSTVDALRAATFLPPLVHGVKDRGRIQPGYRADLVLLQPDADPIRYINDTRKLARVWNGGLEYFNLSTSESSLSTLPLNISSGLNATASNSTNGASLKAYM